MGTTTITALPAGSSIVGTEPLPADQAGATVKFTLSTIFAWVFSQLAPTYSAAVLAGPNNVVLPGAGDYVFSVNTSAGIVTYSGFVSQRDGQKLTFIANGANGIKFLALQTSNAANQIQAAGETDIVGGDSITLRYSNGFGKWLFT
jgi:hypothetical protein